VSIATLGDAVFAAIYRGELGVDGRDRDDRARRAACERRLLEHPTGDPLGQEERTAQVDVQTAIVALERDVEQVAAIKHRDAGVVDQAVEPAEGAVRRVD
jgi:hypothetical protein